MWIDEGKEMYIFIEEEAPRITYHIIYEYIIGQCGLSAQVAVGEGVSPTDKQ